MAEIDYASMTLEDLNYEIQKLRSSTDNLKEGLKPALESRRSFEKEEQEFMKEMQKKLADLRLRKEEAASTVANIESLINKNSANVDFLQKLMAKKLEAEHAKSALVELEARIIDLLKDMPAYKMIRPYQHEDIIFSVNAYHEGRNGVLNANEMSLGKTFEAAIVMMILHHDFEKQHGRAPRTLWLTKSSLIKSSFREIKTWWPEAPIVPLMGNWGKQQREYTFQLAFQTLGAGIITNYEAPRTTAQLRHVEWDFVFIDEVHKLKGGANPNGPTNVWKVTKEICRKARFIFMMSGTPMVNHPAEMWSYLHIFDPERFYSLKNFRAMFETSSWDPALYQYVAAIDIESLLKNALKGQVIRRTKKEVGLQLPDKIRQFHYLEMTEAQREVYEQMRTNFFIWLDSQAEEKKSISTPFILAQLTRLRQISVWPPSVAIIDPDDPEGKAKVHVSITESSKIDEAMDLIETLSGDEGESIVLFSTFNEPLFEIERRCKELEISCKTLTGHNSFETGDIEQAFQNREFKVLAMNLTMGAGLNLHKNPDRWEGGAAHAIFLDLWWTPAINQQAEDRIHRPGQTDNVIIHILHNEDSVDSFIASKLEEKDALFSSIMESKELRPATEWKDILQGLV